MTPKRRRQTADFPTYCDYSCPHAAFGDPSTVGACRREVGVWCGRAGRFNRKHAHCFFREDGPSRERGR